MEKDVWRMMAEALIKQLQLLSERSQQEDVTIQELCDLSMALTEVTKGIESL